jgi:hypothetical protein
MLASKAYKNDIKFKKKCDWYSFGANIGGNPFAQ